MGFFSWRTQDTDKSIANKWSTRDTFRVQMMDDKGNVWTEDSYDGYGEFGGKDYYELLAEMNGLTGNGTDDLRMKGIELAFKENPSGNGTEGVLYPNLVEMADGWRYDPMGPDSCEEQGFFYDDSELEDDFFDEDEN